jgi:hypothetical protein
MARPGPYCRNTRNVTKVEEAIHVDRHQSIHALDGLWYAMRCGATAFNHGNNCKHEMETPITLAALRN